MASREDSFVNSIIGEGARFIGNIELNGHLRIDGDYDGAIKHADRVLISRTGRAKSTIRAHVVVIGGSLIGDVIADESLVILSTAIVIGNVKSPLIVIEEGVILHGICEVTTRNLDHDEKQLSTVKAFSVDWQEPAKTT